MSNQRQYEKVGGGSNNNAWAPHKDTTKVYSDSNPAVLEGYYLKSNVVQQAPPKKDFKVHEIHEVNEDGSLGEILDVSLGIGLSNTLEKILTGTFVRLEYKGKKPAKIQGQTFNDVGVFQDKNAVPYLQVTGGKDVQTTATSNEQKAVNTGTKNPAAASNSPFPTDVDFDEVPF